MEGKAATAKRIFAGIKAAIIKDDFKRATAMIEQALATDDEFAKGRNIRLAHWLVMGANWSLINQLIPSNTNSLQTSGWLNSILSQRPVNEAGQPIPWLTYPAIEFIESLVRSDWSVFEWGGGSSTLWWSERVSKVHTIEHNRQFHDTIIQQIEPNVTLRLCEAHGEYVDAITSSQGGPFDVIVIDGEERNACARTALQYLKPNGMIVYDNSDRLMYRDGFEFLSGSGLKRIDFFGLIPSYVYKNCTSIFFFDDKFMRPDILPSDKISCVGSTCSQAAGERSN